MGTAKAVPYFSYYLLSYSKYSPTFFPIIINLNAKTKVTTVAVTFVIG